MKGLKKTLKKVWHFIWEEDSFWSWLVNIVLAFLIIKFVFYPGIGFLLRTNYPIVAVISESMEHKINPACMEVDSAHNCIRYYSGLYVLCNTTFTQQYKVDRQLFWRSCGSFYEARGISEEQFFNFPFANGLNKGDLIILFGKKPSEIKVGDVVVYSAGNFEPIIHRVVSINISEQANSTEYYFTTKGDHNPDSIIHDLNIPQEKILGVGILRIPLLGYVKIWFFNYVANPLLNLIRR